MKIKKGDFKKGHIPWNKGLTKYTDERLKQFSKLQKGKHTSISTEFKKGHKGTSWNKGRKFTEEEKRKMKKNPFAFKKGHIPWNKNSTIIICAYCKKEFEVPLNRIRRGVKYCSKECYSLAHKPLVIKCKICDKEFEAYLSHIKAGKKYCSRKCQSIAAKKRVAEKRITKICKHCGGKYIVPPRNRSTYCSEKCYKLMLKEKGEKTKVKVSCKSCGKAYTVYINYRRKNGDFCSKECWYEYYHNTHSILDTCKMCGKVFHRNLSSQKRNYNNYYCSIGCSAKAHSGSNNCRWHGGKEKCWERYLESNKYILKLLTRKDRGFTILEPEDIPQGLTDLKRAELKLHRIIKEAESEIIR